MSTAQLAELAGLLARLCARRARRGDTRDKTAIADSLLESAAAPDLSELIGRLSKSDGNQ